ncbi:hypothetical protein MRX96_029611 [Rhipicephalus microplus]
MERYNCDKVREILVAGNLDPKSNVSRDFDVIRQAQVKPGAPIVVSEYYTGWMNYWGWDDNPAYPPWVIATFEKMMEQGGQRYFLHVPRRHELRLQGCHQLRIAVGNELRLRRAHGRRRRPEGLLLHTTQINRQVHSAQIRGAS